MKNLKRVLVLTILVGLSLTSFSQKAENNFEKVLDFVIENKVKVKLDSVAEVIIVGDYNFEITETLKYIRINHGDKLDLKIKYDSHRQEEDGYFLFFFKGDLVMMRDPELTLSIIGEKFIMAFSEDFWSEEYETILIGSYE